MEIKVRIAEEKDVERVAMLYENGSRNSAS